MPATTLDAVGRQAALSEDVGGTTYTDTFGYNVNDLLTSVSLSGDVQESAQYDANSRLTSWHDPGPGQDVTYGYGYDAASRRSSVTAVSGTDSITHDAQGRMTDETGPRVITAGGADHWTYDSNGNLTSAIDDTGVTQTYSYYAARGRHTHAARCPVRTGGRCADT